MEPLTSSVIIRNMYIHTHLQQRSQQYLKKTRCGSQSISFSHLHQTYSISFVWDVVCGKNTNSKRIHLKPSVH